MDVALVERSSLEAPIGSSKGTARIFTPAAYPDASTLESGLRALEGWREIEARNGKKLLDWTGALSRGEFAERELALLRDAGVEARLLSAAEASRRFGVDVSGDAPLLYQPGAGIIRADRAHSALLSQARAAGAELHEREEVRSISERPDALEVETERRRWRCASVVVAAGPWSRGLLAGAGIDVPLSVSRQSVAYFDVQGSRPVALMEFDGEEPYALWDPGRGLKAAFHARGPTVGDLGDATGVESDTVDRLAAWVRARFGRLRPRPNGAETCLYTNTADERFMLERRGRIVIASACNGQGFQHAPATAQRVASLALEVDAARV